jgi:hypothetical protein
VQAPPTIELDDAFVLDAWRPEDAPSHRVFAEDADAARFLGWTVEEAGAAPDSYYVDGMQNFQYEWESGSQLSLAIRRRVTGGQSARSSSAPWVRSRTSRISLRRSSGDKGLRLGLWTHSWSGHDASCRYGASC